MIEYKMIRLTVSTWWLSIKTMAIIISIIGTPKIQLLYQNF
jgi:hypothetical protein